MPKESSANKVKEICDLLYKDTILPAKEESEKILIDAKEHAASIIHDANEKAKALLEKNVQQIAEERRVHECSIGLAIKQAIAVLKSQVMSAFNEELLAGLKGSLSQQEVCKNILDVMIDGIQKEGIGSNLRLFVSKNVNYEALAKSLTASVAAKIEKGDMEISSGVALMVKDKRITFKITENTLMELLSAGLPEVLKNKVFA